MFAPASPGTEDTYRVLYDALRTFAGESTADLEMLADWLQEYSLSELWEKNVLGGRPA